MWKWVKIRYNGDAVVSADSNTKRLAARFANSRMQRL